VHYPCCERGGAIPLIMQLLLQYYLPEQTPRDRNHGSHSHEVPEFSDCQLRGVAGVRLLTDVRKRYSTNVPQ
jgi:hypothetical protein